MFYRRDQPSERFYGDYGAADSSGSWSAYTGPALSGLIIGLASYGVARSFDVPGPKSWGIAATMGLVTAIGQIAGAWLRTKVDEAQTIAALAAPKVSPTVAAAAPTAPTQPVSPAPAGLMGLLP